MRICFICNFRHYSGALEVFRIIAKHAKAAGHSCTYVYHQERHGDTAPDMSMFDEVKYMPYRGEDRTAYGIELANFANEFDVVHTSLIPQDWRFLFKRNVRRPMVETYHSPDGWKMCWQQMKWRALANVEAAADVTVGVSHGLTSKIAESFASLEQTAGAKVICIPNGVEIPPEIATDGDYVTYAGRISQGKGLDTWLSIAEKIHRMIPAAKFQWVGELSPGYDDFTYRCLQAAAPWLECVGFKQDMAPYYRRSKVLLLTSPSEGLPMVILEAAAHGVPSIAFDSGDISETPALIARDDAHAAELIRWCFGIPQDRASIRQKVIDGFSEQSMAAKYLEVYRSLALA